MTNTALSAKAEQIAQNVTFRDEEHKKFFLTYLPKCRYGDVYHAALVYCLGLMRTQEEILKQSTILRRGVSKRNACMMAGLQVGVQR